MTYIFRIWPLLPEWQSWWANPDYNQPLLILAGNEDLGIRWGGAVKLEAPWAECPFLIYRGIFSSIAWHLDFRARLGKCLCLLYLPAAGAGEAVSCTASCWCSWCTPRMDSHLLTVPGFPKHWAHLPLEQWDCVTKHSFFFLSLIIFYLHIGSSGQSCFLFRNFSLLPPWFMFCVKCKRASWVLNFLLWGLKKEKKKNIKNHRTLNKAG